jgi:hypothetical protein
MAALNGFESLLPLPFCKQQTTNKKEDMTEIIAIALDNLKDARDNGQSQFPSNDILAACITIAKSKASQVEEDLYGIICRGNTGEFRFTDHSFRFFPL